MAGPTYRPPVRHSNPGTPLLFPRPSDPHKAALLLRGSPVILGGITRRGLRYPWVFINPLPVVHTKTRACDAGAGFDGYGHRLLWKTPG
ncbi:hypothetical protein K443DRAFT_187001 [Laccaria amethystina LaAM-08-1]|uniref:Uncharacterized protein n=1 Tax=Laccaria amethystina LaAM-08-1 TaxID=1095629 RepID=A0A0C9Y0X8_9AGAR|nr:hypothetical protein K443DRAFT_187001 [Laccaria amethystina LaAM-08-1]